MKTIEIDGKSYLIDIEKAAEQGLLKEKDSKPRSWEEYVKMAETVQIVPCDAHANYFDKRQRRITYDVFNSVNEAKAFWALGRLIQLRDAWWGEWKPDWSNDEDKYHVGIMVDEICIDKAIHIQHVLAFPTEEMAIDFLDTFRDLTEEAKMFL